jgi:uncharacterized membrane protein
MWILVIILIGVVIFGLIAGFFYNRSIQKKIERGELKEAPEIKTVDEECCGQHEICEKESLLAAVSKQIEYYDDEELDRFKGLVRCGNCKRAMTRRKNKAGIRYFQCIHSVNNGNTDCPVGRSFPEMDIEKVVFHALTQFLALAQKESVQNREVGDLRKSAIKECAEKIRILQKQNEQHKASKLRLYEKYAAGSITKEAYIQQKAAADVKIAENDGVIQRSHERMKELDSETACSDEKLDAVCEQYADCKALTYELTHAFISAVYIYDLDNIEIVWKFKDFLTTSEGEAK